MHCVLSNEQERFTPEFKGEAVRQVTERGYAMKMLERFAVFAHSLSKWVKAIKPDKSEQHAHELVAARGEILKLRAQLKRTQDRA